MNNDQAPKLLRDKLASLKWHLTEGTVNREIIFDLIDECQRLTRPSNAPVSHLRDAFELLSLEWRGWAQAIRLIDGKRETSDSASLRQAAAYEECGEKLHAALPPDEPARVTSSTVGKRTDCSVDRYDALPQHLRDQIMELEIFIGDVDGHELDDGGTVDASDAVNALNKIIAAMSPSTGENCGEFMPLTLKPLDDPNHDPGEHWVLDATIASEKECGKAVGVHHKLDNDRQVFFYEQDFYVLSNFSAFQIEWDGRTFATSEQAYHYERFPVHGGRPQRAAILKSKSAHEAFRYAQDNKRWQRDDWDALKVGIMRDILRAKANQHEYVRRKLLATGERELIEDSWRDACWGWGPNRDGKNMLGKLWMEIRTELRAAPPAALLIAKGDER